MLRVAHVVPSPSWCRGPPNWTLADGPVHAEVSVGRQPCPDEGAALRSVSRLRLKRRGGGRQHGGEDGHRPCHGINCQHIIEANREESSCRFPQTWARHGQIGEYIGAQSRSRDGHDMGDSGQIRIALDAITAVLVQISGYEKKRAPIRIGPTLSLLTCQARLFLGPISGARVR